MVNIRAGVARRALVVLDQGRSIELEPEFGPPAARVPLERDDPGLGRHPSAASVAACSVSVPHAATSHFRVTISLFALVNRTGFAVEITSP